MDAADLSQEHESTVTTNDPTTRSKIKHHAKRMLMVLNNLSSTWAKITTMTCAERKAFTSISIEAETPGTSTMDSFVQQCQIMRVWMGILENRLQLAAHLQGNLSQEMHSDDQEDADYVQELQHHWKNGLQQERFKEIFGRCDMTPQVRSLAALREKVWKTMVKASGRSLEVEHGDAAQSTQCYG
ncbi:hypothetical protein VC83_08370 [Pseudogymnoascus destructans]|uniref:Uncharacterized protein n=2 Tax=Pseudogymnoascus destructans TaxID=655981 RepID=L8G8E0_PSED2|nr:uncharacterized protein VC83_08370 [Pseudogymnoascus destructans]ELR08286.1 hypothetical protein GMDG_03084 [Pseudogymnoascus destructans 20631-21]OAF55491.1 hypothetical protein VC83_08370 [Pseudogymnoascus destructans]